MTCGTGMFGSCSCSGCLRLPERSFLMERALHAYMASMHGWVKQKQPISVACSHGARFMQLACAFCQDNCNLSPSGCFLMPLLLCCAVPVCICCAQLRGVAVAAEDAKGTLVALSQIMQ